PADGKPPADAPPPPAEPARKPTSVPSSTPSPRPAAGPDIPPDQVARRACEISRPPGPPPRTTAHDSPEAAAHSRHQPHARPPRLPARRVPARLGLLAVAVLPFVVVLPATLDPVGAGWDVGPAHVSEKGIETGAGVALRCLAVGAVGLVLAGTAPLPRTFA